MRNDNRNPHELRPISLTPNFTQHAEGSVLIEFGKTRVICTATVDPSLPKWLHGTNQGWVTAEYGMLPRSTHSRVHREKALHGGRTQEISRLIGRSLRASLNLKLLGERQIIVDCDVIQADGGTRTAAITGGFIALAFAIRRLLEVHEIKQNPLKRMVAAVSVGLTTQDTLLDLNYEEDSDCETDMNFVMGSDGGIIEIQGTAEGEPFRRQQFDQMLSLAEKGCQQIFEMQKQWLGGFFNG